jgi:hypothetical protein
VLVINEVMQNPSAVNDSDGEYFEIYNPGASPVNIEGWTISDAGSESHTINNGGPLEVPAMGFLVLGINSDFASNGGVTVDYEYTGINLANGDDELILTDTGSNEIDRVEWDGGTNWPDPTGASMELSDPNLDNNVGSNWATATSTFGNGIPGRPGQPMDRPYLIRRRLRLSADSRPMMRLMRRRLHRRSQFTLMKTFRRERVTLPSTSPVMIPLSEPLT